MNVNAAVIHNSKFLGTGQLPINTQKRLAALLAFYQEAHKLDPDGKYDQATEELLDTTLAQLSKPTPASPFLWSFFDGPLTERPKTLADIIRIFGHPGKQKLDMDWMQKNIVELHGDKAFLPVLRSRYFPVHRLIEPYFREAFKRAEIVQPGYIKADGTWAWNYRHMRHDEDMPLSRHSWGIAVDINPDDNEAEEFGPGKTPTPWSAAWMKRWPRGVSRLIVEAFESCGFSWGGYWKGFVDPMHFEWCGQREVQV